MNLRRNRKMYKNNQKVDSYCMDLLRGKIEFLLSEYGLDETCKMSASMIKKIIECLRKQGKENAIVEYKIKRGRIEKNYVLLGVNNQVIKFDLKSGTAEITNCTKTIREDEKPTEYMDLKDLTLEERVDFLYTLDNFIADTNFNVLTKKSLPTYRPAIVCKDGFLISVQASKLSASRPKENNRTDYTHFEISDVSEEIPELEPYRSKIGGGLNNIYDYVPKKLVEKILKEHGGIDVIKTLAPSELSDIFNENIGYRRRMSYLDNILKKVDRYDELNRAGEKDAEEALEK